MSAKNKPNEIYITRIYDAPVKMIWDAWVEPDQVAKWWGPRGFTITTYSKDVRPGGTWDYMMHGPDGTDYPNLTKFHEVEKYSRLVYDHGGSKDRPPLFRVTVIFTEITKNKTQMEMTMALETPEAAKEIKKHIKKAGGNSTWDRLAEYLSSEDKFVINRSFEVPKDKMFEMWTNPEHFSKWLPPIGMKMNFIKADIREGGTSFFRMYNDEGFQMFGKFTYQEIKPDGIVYTQVFCDENGVVGKSTFDPNWPLQMIIRVCFTEEGPNQTRVTASTEVYGEANKAERDTFHNAKGSMTEGWTGSFDKLANLFGIE